MAKHFNSYLYLREGSSTECGDRAHSCDEFLAIEAHSDTVGSEWRIATFETNSRPRRMLLSHASVGEEELTYK